MYRSSFKSGKVNKKRCLKNCALGEKKEKRKKVDIIKMLCYQRDDITSCTLPINFVFKYVANLTESWKCHCELQ